MKPPKLMRLPADVEGTLTRMECGEREWQQDEDGDLHVIVPVKLESVSAHWHYIWVWCGTRFVLWSSVLVDDRESDETDDDEEGG